MTRPTHATLVHELLIERPEGITPLDALREIGTMRLASRIFDLRSRGIRINDETVTVRTRLGGTARVKRYWLASEAVQLELV